MYGGFFLLPMSPNADAATLASSSTNAEKSANVAMDELCIEILYDLYDHLLRSGVGRRPANCLRFETEFMSDV